MDTADRTERGGWTVAADQAHGYSIAFSPSGDWLAVSGDDGVVRILSAESGEELLSHNQHLEPRFTFSNSAVFSNDGKVIAAPHDGRVVELWDAASGETIRRFEAPRLEVPRLPVKKDILQKLNKSVTISISVDLIAAAFSPDGRLLAVEAPYENSLLVFDVATAKQLHLMPLGARGQGSTSLTVKSVVFTPDGDVLATSNFVKTIALWDVKTGKKIRELSGHDGSVAGLSISPEGRVLASCACDWNIRMPRVLNDDSVDHTIRLWDVSTGRPLLTIKGHTDNVRSVVYSSDGRSLLSGGEDKTIRLWEVSTGKQLCRWDMDEKVNQVAMSPDCTIVAAVLDGGSITLFPIDGPQPDKVQPAVDENAFDRWWADLTAEDAEQAYRAVRDLTQASEDVPSLLAKRLRPARSLPLLIADLNHDDFDRREAASKEVAALSAQAEPALRKALAETDSLEVRSRITRSLKPLGEWVVTDPNTLRALRAIWVLERIGTPDARVVLEDLAKGAPEARQTQEAKSALDFLDKRAAAKP